MPSPSSTSTQSLPALQDGDIVTGIVTSTGSPGLVLDLNGTTGFVYESEIPLAAGETSSDRYAIGDQVDALILWIDPDDYHLMLSVSRISPDYLEAYMAFNIGDIVTGTVMGIDPEGLNLDVNGVDGWIPNCELSLADGEELSNHYAVGDRVRALVLFIDSVDRGLSLSARRASPNYEKAFATFDTGDIVTGTITGTNLGFLNLDINGVSGRVFNFNNSEIPSDRYIVGAKIRALILSVNSVDRDLWLSIRRASPIYEEAFATFDTGDIVTGIVTDTRPGLLDLDVNGVDGWISDSDLPLIEGKMPSEHYAIGDQVTVLVEFVDSEYRCLKLSIHNIGSGDWP